MINPRRQAPVATSTLPVLMEATENPNATAASIADAVATDAGLVSRVLALANSAQFGLSRTVYKLDHAIGLVGMTTVRTLAIASATLLLEADNGLENAKEHALATGCLAKVIAQRTSTSWQDAFAAGLLHDLGELLLLQHAPTEYSRLREGWTGVDHQLQTERDLYGDDHAALGAAHLEQWGIPMRLTHAVRDHHSPSEQVSHLSLVVAAADELADGGIGSVALTLLGLAHDDWTEIVAGADEELDDIRSIFTGAPA